MRAVLMGLTLIMPMALAAPAAAQAGAGRADSAQAGADTSVRLARRTLHREVFSYNDGGRRDPMRSLMNSADLRPLLVEVEIISILYDQDGTNHMVQLRNKADKKKLYRLKVGDMIGRNRVTQITRTDVLFTIDEFGFSRQERLSIKPDTTAARSR